MTSTATEATPVGGAVAEGGTRAGRPPVFGAGAQDAPAAKSGRDSSQNSANSAIGTFQPNRTDRSGQIESDAPDGGDADPYIYGTDEATCATILLDLRELRQLEAAERAAGIPPATGLSRRDEAATLLYADGGTAIPLARVREVCHDLRQPVAAILMLASAAEMRPDVPDSVKAALQEITDQAEDISTAVRQFLDDAKRGVDGLGDPRPVNVVALARESIDRWRATYQGLLDFAAADDPLHVTVDPVLFRRALGNLLSNATRAADVGGHVAVTVRRFQTGRGGRAVIEVDDSGPGFGNIPSGHGLGLAVVRRTVEAAGGSVEFAEGVLGGALVRLVLPVTAQQGDDDLAASFHDLPLSALADLDGFELQLDDELDAIDEDEDIAGGEEIADGHVLATRISALPPQEAIAAAPYRTYATPVWAQDAERRALVPRPAPSAAPSRAELTGLAHGFRAAAPTRVISRAELTAAAGPDAGSGAPTRMISRSELATAAGPAAEPADAEPSGAASGDPVAEPFDAFAARTAPPAQPGPHRSRPEPRPSSAPAQHANALRLPSRANLTMPPRLPVPAGVPQVAAQLSLLPGGAF